MKYISLHHFMTPEMKIVGYHRTTFEICVCICVCVCVCVFFFFYAYFQVSVALDLKHLKSEQKVFRRKPFF
jgi:hypothetical protein